MPEYCVYEATQSAPNLNPPIRIGDTFCVDCPPGGVCKGEQGHPKSIKIKDKEGDEKQFRAVLQNASCASCPEDGLKGYEFVAEAEASGNGGWTW